MARTHLHTWVPGKWEIDGTAATLWWNCSGRNCPYQTVTEKKFRRPSRSTLKVTMSDKWREIYERATWPAPNESQVAGAQTPAQS